MENIFVTIGHGNDQYKDLILPCEIPSQIVAESLREDLQAESPKNHAWLLSLDIGNKKKIRIPPAVTLGKFQPIVFCGSFLFLESDVGQGYLLGENGNE